MIAKIFKKYEDEQAIVLDYESIQQHTSSDFVSLVKKSIGIEDIALDQLKFTTEKKVSLVYFVAAGQWYSFCWDKKSKQLLFSEKIGKKWSFVVGFK